MSLKKSQGNMYPWISHMHAHLGGRCPHQCSYCYVDDIRGGRPAKYQGPLRLIPEEFKVKYGKDKTIFIEHCNDFLAAEVPALFILQIITHCIQWPENTYVFQTKNPARFRTIDALLPDGSMIGTTIETNRDIHNISKAPRPFERMLAMERLSGRKFVTIEPVLDFDVDILASWIDRIRPEFLNLGADSKHHHLPEPTIDKIEGLVNKLKEYGIELREKHNLDRLLKRSQNTQNA